MGAGLQRARAAARETRRATAVAIPADKLVEIFAFSLKTHATADSRAALRCALGDASAICDMIANAIQDDGRRGNHPLKRAQEDAALATNIGDKIWAFRELVTVPRETVSGDGE